MSPGYQKFKKNKKGNTLPLSRLYISALDSRSRLSWLGCIKKKQKTKNKKTKLTIKLNKINKY